MNKKEKEFVQFKDGEVVAIDGENQELPHSTIGDFKKAFRKPDIKYLKKKLAHYKASFNLGNFMKSAFVLFAIASSFVLYQTYSSPTISPPLIDSSTSVTPPSTNPDITTNKPSQDANVIDLTNEINQKVILSYSNAYTWLESYNYNRLTRSGVLKNLEKQYATQEDLYVLLANNEKLFKNNTELFTAIKERIVNSLAYLKTIETAIENFTLRSEIINLSLPYLEKEADFVKVIDSFFD